MCLLKDKTMCSEFCGFAIEMYFPIWWCYPVLKNCKYYIMTTEHIYI